MNTRTNPKDSSSSSSQNAISLRSVFFTCIYKWYWFVLAVAVSLVVAFIYLASTHPNYRSAACLVIKQDRRTGGSGMETSFSNLSNMGSLFTQQTNVHNEIIAFESPVLMEDVVKRLSLRSEYTTPYHLYDRVLYGSNLPVKVIPVDMPQDKTFKLTIRCRDTSGVELVNMVTYIGREEVKFKEAVPVAYYDTVDTPVGRLTVIPGMRHFSDGKPFKDIDMSYSTLAAAVNRYSSQFSVSLTQKEATAISLSQTDRSAERARDVLAAVIDAYNEMWINDRNQIAVSTSKFINERLVLLERELGEVDSDISNFKATNLIVDPAVAGDLFFTQANKIMNEIAELQNRKSMAGYVREYLTSPSSVHQLLPANTGLDNTGIESLIAEYNTSMLTRNRLSLNSSESSPVVDQMDKDLAATKASIVESIENFIVSLDTQIKSLEKMVQTNRNRISDSPKQIEYLTDIQRQQKVKESLYLYLLQKREENELSQAFAAYNTRILMPATLSRKPVAPVSGRLLLIALVFGLAVPAVWIYLKMSLNTTIEGKKDIESLNIPFLGEIPIAVHKRKLFRRRSKGTPRPEVKPHERNMINEAFRVVRSNLEFMCGKRDGGLVLQTTSFNVGSGKTFVSVNLASVFAIKKQKVCLLDLDIRKASLSEYVNSPKLGIVDYLAENCDDIDKLIIRNTVNENLDIIPVGSIPPNPSELLYSPKLEQLMNILRERYDYIFLDCPPSDIVADTFIINKYVDRTIFLVRAGLLEKDLLPEINKYHEEDKLKGMMLLLNGTDNVSLRRSNRKYGYGYGYGYGSDLKVLYGRKKNSSRVS